MDTAQVAQAYGGEGVQAFLRTIPASGALTELTQSGILSGSNQSGPDETKGTPDNQGIPIEKMGKYSQVLNQAKQKSPQALAVTNYVLSQSDPEYQRMMRTNNGIHKPTTWTIG